MINSPLKFLDNTGCYFYSENDYFILGKSLAGYSGINNGYAGYTIPYLCRGKNNQYEVGTGEIINDNGRLIVKRVKVLSSSNNNNPISFPEDPNNALYCFVNSYSFRTGLNNLIKTSGVFHAENIRATYLVDITKENSTATLPSVEHNKSLVIEFQTSNSSSNQLYVKDTNHNTILKLSGNSYTKLISTGSEWVELKDYGNSSNSFSSANFRTLSADADGDTGTLQYNNNGFLGATNIYYNNDKLLLGSNSVSSAYSILPLSGNGPTVLNNLSAPSDFIVRGSGDRNLFFGYDGRLGLNIPSGIRPQTALHIVNNGCQDSIRLENRNPCFQANLTLLHKPPSVISTNSTISTINLSSKNSVDTNVDFVQLKGKVISPTVGATAGEFSISVDKLGQQVETIKTNANNTSIKTSNNNSIQVSSSGIDLVGQVRLSNLKWSSGSAASGLFLMTDNSGNIILTNVNNSPIINALDPGIVVFTGVCT